MPSFMAFSARARSQMSDPLAAAASDGSARPPSPRAIMGPGTGRLPAPNGAERDASDDGMSSVGLGEAEARQQFLDAAAAPFLAATGTGVYNEVGEELYTDDTFRPVSSPAADRPNRGAPPEYYDIATDQDADVAVEPADSTQGRKRLADRAGTEQRSTSPRRAIADHSPDSSPELLDGSSDEEPATPRTRSRRTENSVRLLSLKGKQRSPRSTTGTPRARSTSPRTDHRMQVDAARDQEAPSSVRSFAGPRSQEAPSSVRPLGGSVVLSPLRAAIFDCAEGTCGPILPGTVDKQSLGHRITTMGNDNTP